MNQIVPWKQKPAPVAVGALARQALIRLRTGRHLRARTFDTASRRLANRLAYLLMGCWLTARYGRAVARQYGVGVPRQIAAQLRLMFQDGINPKIYYFLELFRIWSPEIGRQCLMRHEIKTGLLRALHKQRPRVNGNRISLGHKLEYGDFCRSHDLPSPTILLVGKAGRLEWRSSHDALASMDLFLKPEIGRGAWGAHWFRNVGWARYRSSNGSVVSLDDILDLVARRSKAQGQILQELLNNHPSIADLAQDSLLVFRVFTCIDRFGEPVVTHAMLRALSKLEPGWHGSEEFAAPVDLVTGTLGLMCGDQHYGPTDWYEAHPVTGAQVAGRVIEHWPEIEELALSGHRVFRDRMLLGWDVALTTGGPVLIEANAYPDTEFLQRVHRKPIGASPLGEILTLQIERMCEKVFGTARQ
jgi:hypothetical protein